MRFAVAILAVVFVAIAGVRGSGPTRPDLRVVNDYAALQGTWEMVASETHGRASAAREVWTFRGDHLLRLANNNLLIDYRIEMHSTTRPGWLDLSCFHAGQRGTAAALYRLNGGSLQVCMGGKRPQRFDTKPNGGGATLFNLKRVPPSPNRPLDRSAIAEPPPP